jgi:tetratricopeptide (TPR) repeat protein
MKAAEFTGSVDPSGYSASAATQTKSSLLEGAADLRNQATWTAHDERSAASSDLNVSSTLRETQLKRLEGADPKGFKPNHELGEFYFDAGKLSSAIPFLETARRANSADYDNDYTLARAYWESQRLEDARSLIAETMALHDTSELHNLLAQIEESQGNHSVALKEYERAFQMEPVEENRYDLGLELLLQGDIASASKLFKEGLTLNPQSAKSWIGLGIALYSGGHSEEAVSAFLSAIDLYPADPRPYLFLGKAYNISNKVTAAVNTRMNRWIQLEPGNARAYYYYALSLWRGNRDTGLDQDMERIESLFKESAWLDPTFPFAHLQLGNLYFGENRFPEAIAEYQDAVRLKPELAEAHYRLGQAFLRTDRKELGQQQMAIYEQLHRKQSPQPEQVEGRQFIESIKEGVHTNLVSP